MEVLLIFFVFFVFVCLIKLGLRPANFPPGPRGFPLLGYLPLIFLNEPVHIALRNLAEKYGPVTGLFLGPVQPFISVDGPKAVREVLQNDDLIGRPSTIFISKRTYGEKLGLIFVDGEFWQEQRRFTHRHLRDLGFGKTSIEDQMMDEVNDLISDISNNSKSNAKNVVDFSSLFTVSVINVLWAIVGDKRFQRDDQIFKHLLDCVGRLTQNVNSVQGVVSLPKLLIKLIPALPKLLGVDMEVFIPVQRFVEEAIEEHLKTRSNNNDAARDFIDVYLNEMDDEKTNKNKSLSTFSKKQLVSIVMDLFGAGSETSSNTIGFAILYMIHFQEIQKKMQFELDNVCGESLPSLIHRPSLPYSEAFMMEILRFSTPIPFVFHRAVRDTQIQGFTIPKDSIVTVNFDSVFNDPAVWKDPTNFRPERHLDADGKIVKNDAFIPFGIGKRNCLGESLARNTVFLFVTTIVKKFEFKPIPGERLPTLKPISGFTRGPTPYKAVVVPRKLL